MRRRWGANVWLLIIVGAVGLAIGADVLTRTLRPPATASGPTEEEAAAARAAVLPDFQEGDPAPDFSLPDAKGRIHKLSRLATGDTLLWFTCGCANCIDLQTYLATLVQHLPGSPPLVVNVTTMPREREQTYRRDVRLRQIFLYEKKDGPIMAQFRGHPCPRIYQLGKGRAVRWISPSPRNFPFIDAIGNQLAERLGFQEPGGRDPGKPPAPRWSGPPRSGS